MHMKRRQPLAPAGFTLIEVIITVAIVGILAAIAIPAYTAYIRRADRTDATRTMMKDAQALQRCYSQYFTYTPTAPATCSVTGGTTSSPSGYYAINVSITGGGTAYLLTATPQSSPQTGDTQCTSFTLNSAGAQTAVSSTGVNTASICWGQ
jgi:type IV pilus assembly protein PilE